MEHYKKKQSRYIDEESLPNEMRVGSTGKAHDLATRALHRLKDNPQEGVVISASGGHVTKAVTVVELLKRRVPGLHQDTQIKYIRVEDVWEPDLEGLDTLKVTRHIPAISVHLSEGGGGEKASQGRGRGRRGRGERSEQQTSADTTAS